MTYKILEIHAVYQDQKLTELAVLWQSNPEYDLVRATYFTTTPRTGYYHLMPNETISNKLIQLVAGYGMNLPDDKKAIYFPGNLKWDL